MTTQKPQGRNDGHLMDYSLVADHIYVGSNLCQGPVCPIHGPEFLELDICVEINLDNERREIPPEQLESYTWIPVVDGHAPRQVQLDIGSAIIHAALAQNKNVYIHCKNGHGRGPTLAAAYLVRYTDSSVEAAERQLQSKRPEIHIENTQKAALEEFKARWSK